MNTKLKLCQFKASIGHPSKMAPGAENTEYLSIFFLIFASFVKFLHINVLRRVGMGTILELSLRKVGILTLPGEVRMPTWHGSIPELSLRKVGIGKK